MDRDAALAHLGLNPGANAKAIKRACHERRRARRGPDNRSRAPEDSPT